MTAPSIYFILESPVPYLKAYYDNNYCSGCFEPVECFLFPRMMLTKSNLRTIALSQYYFTGEYGNKWELAFAAYLLTIIPILILYFLLQKNIIQGVAAGAVKG